MDVHTYVILGIIEEEGIHCIVKGEMHFDYHSHLVVPKYLKLADADGL